MRWHEMASSMAGRERCYPLEDNVADAKNRGCEKVSAVALLQAAWQISYPLHLDRLERKAAHWTERTCLSIDKTCRRFRSACPSELPGQRNPEKYRLERRRF